MTHGSRPWITLTIENFIFSPLPQTVQSGPFFEGPLGLRGADFTFRRRCISVWMLKPHGNILPVCFKILPQLIAWYIWRARNNARFEGSEVTHIISEIWSDLLNRSVLQFQNISFRTSSWPELVIFFENIRSFPRAKEVAWEFPKASFKLNTSCGFFLCVFHSISPSSLNGIVG